MITDVGITDDSKKEAKSLSGGTKRKLSVAIALCADSKLVLLDEPTAGMDLNARRALWDMLKNYKHEKIVILTTHYMDEADVLGDRIAIMSEGKVVCLGSSSFLKDHYGSGYKLRFEKKSQQATQKLTDYIVQQMGGAHKLTETKRDVTYQISFDAMSQNPNFLADIDNKMNSLEIESYSIAMTTLEEVFLKANGISYEE